MERNNETEINFDEGNYWLFRLGDRDGMIRILQNCSDHPKHAFDQYMAERRERIAALSNENLQTLFAIRFVNERLLCAYPFSVEEILAADDEKLFASSNLYGLKNVYLLAQRLLEGDS